MALDPATITAIINAAGSLFNVIGGLINRGMSIQQATQQIIAAVGQREDRDHHRGGQDRCGRISSVTDKGAKDQLGVALDIVGPIAVAARARAGFSTTTLLPIPRQANNNLVTGLRPECGLSTFENEWPPTVEVDYSCLAYNGDPAEIRQNYFSGATPPAAPDMNALGVKRPATPAGPSHSPYCRSFRSDSSILFVSRGLVVLSVE